MMQRRRSVIDRRFRTWRGGLAGDRIGRRLNSHHRLWRREDGYCPGWPRCTASPSLGQVGKGEDTEADPPAGRTAYHSDRSRLELAPSTAVLPAGREANG
jgi:hypothetical protein